MTGVRRALEAGIKDLVYVFSVTESHNQGNVRRPVADSLAELEQVIELINGALHTSLIPLAALFPKQ